jgi:hypothetical protein
MRMRRPGAGRCVSDAWRRYCAKAVKARQRASRRRLDVGDLERGSMTPVT